MTGLSESRREVVPPQQAHDSIRQLLFPAPGSWTQHSVGAATEYTGTASVTLGPGITLHIVQQGEVTPADGNGVLQLVAHNVVFVAADGVGDIPIGELTSVGHETDSCAAG